MIPKGTARRVTFYVDDWQCSPNSGGHLRLRSNITAFRDVGWHVDVVRLAETHTPAPDWAAALGIDWLTEGSHYTAGRGTGLLGRVQYRLGAPGAAACSYYFPRHLAARAAIARRSGCNRLHVIEGIHLANAIPFCGGERMLFSHHDIWHEAAADSLEAQLEIDARAPTAAEIRELRFLSNVEARVCRASLCVLAISFRDWQELQRQVGSHAVHLPLSVGADTLTTRDYKPTAPLQLLHVGKISHLPSYRSLQHLLRDVFPLLGSSTLDHLRLRVIGHVDADNPRTRHILHLREPFAKQVEVVGFVQDLRAELARSDLQVVASTAASGLQTRIVESLAMGLPVLASATAAQGLERPKPGADLLIASTAQEFASVLSSIVMDRTTLTGLSVNGRRFYERNHSRAHVAERLQAILNDLGTTT